MSAKSALPACPKCGTALPSTAPEGLCPRCVFAQLANGDASSDEIAAEAEAPRDTTARPDARLQPEFGDYELLEEIGQGGMGTVYRARQLSLNRPVAIKVIKLGMDTRAVIARFEAERHALALMDHPGIARVFHAGATEAGRPYFVMELVQGARITEYCVRHGLPLRARLELFIKVCHAVQHAHQKGIIHRDLKPSNILVTGLDGEAVPKVIDFGIAKATEPGLTEQTTFTWAGQLVGTPAYLSPEQAELGGLDIDTRSDIYSLGVLLYELLAGRLPFDTTQLAKAGLDEVRRIIREQQPLRPSTRLRQTSTPTSQQSRLSTIQHPLSTDLDCIVMKCLEKEPARRYATANGLAADLQRYLNKEPVLARPPSRLYEFQKTLRRHWVGFAAMAAVLVALAMGATVSTLEAVRVRQAEQHERKLVYAAKVRLMQSAWDQNRVAQVRQLLEETADYPDRGPDGQWIATGSGDRTTMLWDAATGKSVRTLNGHHGGIIALVFSRDSRRLFTGSTDQTAKLWEVASGRVLSTWKVQDDTLNSMCFSADGQRIVTGSIDGTVRVWNAGAGRAALLKGHSSAVFSVAFSPDEERILSASTDGTAKVWDGASGVELLSLRGDAPLYTAIFSPDGRQILTGAAGNGSAKLWSAVTADELAAWQIEEKSANQRVAALAAELAAAEQRVRTGCIGDPGAIKQWLILGPIGFVGEDGSKALAEEQVPHEAQLRPSARDRVSADGRDWFWQEVQLSDSLIDFNQVSQATGSAFVAYCVCYIESQTRQSGLAVKVSAEDQCKIYLNGKQIYCSELPSKYFPDRDVVTGVELAAGLNTVVFKVVKQIKTCRASLRFTDAAGQPVKGIRVTLTPQ